MSKTIHSTYHHGNNIVRHDLTEAEFSAWAEKEKTFGIANNTSRPGRAKALDALVAHVLNGVPCSAHEKPGHCSSYGWTTYTTSEDNS